MSWSISADLDVHSCRLLILGRGRLTMPTCRSVFSGLYFWVFLDVGFRRLITQHCRWFSVAVNEFVTARPPLLFLGVLKTQKGTVETVVVFQRSLFMY